LVTDFFSDLGLEYVVFIEFIFTALIKNRENNFELYGFLIPFEKFVK